MRIRRARVALFAFTCSVAAIAACGDTETSSGPSAPSTTTPDSGGTGDAQASIDSGSGGNDSGGTEDTGVDAAKVLPDGLTEPVAYKSRADSPFKGIVFATYDHFEDWEDGAVNTPGVTPSSTQLGSSFGSLVDSIDGDDGVVDGKCEKDGGLCDSGFAGGSIDFVFDASVLGALPTHVGIAWTDGSPGCDAVFEAYDASDVLIGSKTAAAVGDGTNSGSVDEDRYFTVVHAAGVKKIVVKSSAGGVEVDHLHYGR
jgi:hypothetical protein